MKLRDGKKYETADGVVYRVRIDGHGYTYANNGDDEYLLDDNDPSNPKLIRRHYTKPKPAHKLDLKPSDVVELMAWEDDCYSGLGDKITCGKDGAVDHDYWQLNGHKKGQRPLFRVVSRA